MFLLFIYFLKQSTNMYDKIYWIIIDKIMYTKSIKKGSYGTTIYLYRT